MRAIVVGAARRAAPGGAAATPCDADVLVSQAGASPLSRLQVLVAAGQSFDKAPDATITPAVWAEIRDEAIATVGACDLPPGYPASPAMSYFFAFQAYAVRTLDAVEQFTREQNATTPILATAIGLPVAPSPQPIEVGLSQVVAVGQPGFMVSLAATPGIRSESYFQRHLVASASGLIMNQPADGGGGNQTRFASGELSASFTTQRTVYDWAAEVADAQEETDRQFDVHAWNATRLLAIELRARLAAGTAPRDAIEAALASAVRAYRDATRAYLEQRFVRPEIERPQVGHWGIGLRLRASPEPDFVPELPDKYAASVEGWGDAHLVGATAGLSATGHLSAAYSAQPTSGADRDTLLVDAAGGLSLMLRSSTGATRIAMLGLFRWSPRDIADKVEISGGVTGMVQVPIGGDVALAGTLTWRARAGQSNETTTAVTLAKAL